jgi:hypothetical protein
LWLFSFSLLYFTERKDKEREKGRKVEEIRESKKERERGKTG